MPRRNLQFEQAAAGSLVALIASFSAGGALASAPRAADERALSIRVAAVAAAVEANATQEIRDIAASRMQIAQWRNR
jgi:hypothetical protein